MSAIPPAQGGSSSPNFTPRQRDSADSGRAELPRSGQVELPRLHPGSERFPLGGSEGQHRAGAVLGVTDRHDARQVTRELQAVPAVPAAIAALTPGGAAYVHRSSAPLLIRPREAPRGSASALRVSKISPTLATTDGSSVVCPWSGDSMYRVPGALSALAMAKPPSSPTCAPVSSGTT